MTSDAAPDLVLRRATAADLPALVALLADDVLGKTREDPGLPLAQGYRDAFEAIAASPNQYLMVAEQDGRPVGTLQLILVPGLSRRGAWRGIVEGVRIAADRRGQGLGRHLMAWAIAECRARGCASVQLTTDRRRTDAHRFYEGLGFKPSHAGYKMDLPE
jgi:GNAT superfamily N-acetyltransferase